MGTYINTGNVGFQRARNSEYVDKSGLISVVNTTLFTEHCFSCITDRCKVDPTGFVLTLTIFLSYTLSDFCPSSL